MSLTSTSIAENTRNELESLLDFVMSDEHEQQTAYLAERHIWKGVLLLGKLLMQLFFTAHSEREERHKSLEVAEDLLIYSGQPSRQYVSLFGLVELKRYHYWKKGKSGIHPLDAALSMPDRIYSDCVQALLSALEVWIPQDQTLDLLSRWFDLSIPKKSLQDSAADQAEYMATYYAQHPPVETPAQDTILVVTVDGKGIPMIRKDSPPPSVRRSKGKNKTATKEAIVTAGYSIAPYVRTSENIMKAFLEGATNLNESKPISTRPKPSGKQTFGTLEGKPMRPGQVARAEFEYERHGTLTLIANFNVATGQVLASSLGPTRTEIDFATHIEQTLALDPNACWTFVLDQLNTHKSETLVKLVAKLCDLSDDLGVATLCFRLMQQHSS
jgi:hypothetical protein